MLYKYINGEYIELTEEELRQIEEQRKQSELNYTVVEDKPSQTEIDFAEYVLATETTLENLEIKLGGI